MSLGAEIRRDVLDYTILTGLVLSFLTASIACVAFLTDSGVLRILL